MTADEHRARAEGLLSLAATVVIGERRHDMLAEAQVHAILELLAPSAPLLTEAQIQAELAKDEASASKVAKLPLTMKG